MTLDGEFGRLLCITVKELGKTPKTFRIDRTRTYKREPWDDKELVVQARDELNTYHGLVVHNVRFDLNFLNTRLLHHGFEPLSGSVQHYDTLWVARQRMRLGRNTLDRLLDFLGCDEQKMHLSPAVWQRAAAGSKKDMDLLVKRNVSDVVALEQLFNKLISLMPLKFHMVR